MEAWRRLHSEYDQTSSMRRVAIVQQVQNPPRCQRVEDLGSALEDWLSKKRQYEMFTDRNGRPCQASDDSLVAGMFRLMPKSLEETVMFANEDEGFQELYDRLLAYSSTKQSITMSDNKKTTRKDDPMDVDALSKGKSKGKGKKGSSGKGKGSKGQNNTSNVVCWNCGKSGHYEKDCRQKWRQGKGWSETGAQGYEHADGWTWSGEQADGWWKATDWQSSGQWMSANDETAWNAEEPVGGFEINSTERCWSKNPRRCGKQKTRRWQRPRTSETSSTIGKSESGRRRRRTPTPRASPTAKPTRSPSEGSGPSEWSETSVNSVGSWTMSFSAMKRWFALQTEDEMRFFHEGANLDQSCRSARSCFQETLHDECVIAV